MDKYEVTLKLCTLFKGIPFGPAHIEYIHPSEKWLSFDGVGIFTEGRLHMGPFTAINGDDTERSSSLMIDGRPGDSHYST
jgi:hypothetical protein